MSGQRRTKALCNVRLMPHTRCEDAQDTVQGQTHATKDAQDRARRGARHIATSDQRRARDTQDTVQRQTHAAQDTQDPTRGQTNAAHKTRRCKTLGNVRLMPHTRRAR
eukprot:12355507-Karenia_brevis.AAC.1